MPGLPGPRKTTAKAPPKPRQVGNWWDRVNRNQAKGLQAGFRSGLEEANAKHLEAHGEPVLFETFKIPYAVPAKGHTYTPDFRLRNGIIVETKGVWDAQDRAKHLLVKMQYPELDIRLVFTRGKSPISPGAATTVAQWCEKHGFKWAEKLIPVAWLSEPGPAQTVEEVLAQGSVLYRQILELEVRTGR